MNYILALLIALVILCIIIYYLFIYDDGIIKIESEKDGNAYRVLERYTSKGGSYKDAANRMAELNIFIEKLIKIMEKEYMKEEIDKKNKKYIFTKRLSDRYHYGILSENAPGNPDSTSYVIEKGKLLKICLREANTNIGNLHKMNTLKFVIMHELAHIGSINYGHRYEFWKNFRFLLKFAKKYNLYNPIDYSKNPVSYCGILIKNNPYYIYDEHIKKSYKARQVV